MKKLLMAILFLLTISPILLLAKEIPELLFKIKTKHNGGVLETYSYLRPEYKVIQPNKREICEEEGIIACLSEQGKEIQVFSLQDGRFIESIPTFDAGNKTFNGLYIYKDLVFINYDGIMHVISRSTKKVLNKFAVVSNYGRCVYVARGYVITQLVNKQLRLINKDGSLSIIDEKHPLRNVYQGFYNFFNDAYSETVNFNLDNYIRFISDDNEVVTQYSKVGKHLTTIKLLNIFKALKIRNTYIPMSYQAAASGVLYYVTLDEKEGIEVYRYLTPDFQGKTLMRLFNEDRMLELAKEGVAETISMSDAEWINSLMTEELNALKNCAWALNGFDFPDYTIKRYFETWDWYNPNNKALGSLDSLKPAQQNLMRYVTSVLAKR